MATPQFDINLKNPEADMRDIGDVPSTRDAVFANTLNAISKTPTFENQKYALSLKDVGYEGPSTYDKQHEKAAILSGGSLFRKMRGTWVLTDKATGAPVDERRTTVAQVPYLTDRGTYIVRGNDYTFAKQLRLRPGIFTRRKESGELESHVNVAKGFGHKYLLDPGTGVFRAQFAQSRIPLMPVLRLLGASDSQIREAWGNDIFAANNTQKEDAAVRKLMLKLVRGDTKGKTPEQIAKEAFAVMELDPEVTKRTLGTAYNVVDPAVMLAATKRLIDVHKGLAQTDDRDAMPYQRIVGAEDIFPERSAKGHQEARKLLWRSTMHGNLQKALPGTFNKALMGAILDTGLGNPAEEVNMLELLDQWHKVTRTGEGGITSTESIPEDSRSVQPSQTGFVDIVSTAESDNIGVDNRLSIHTRKGKDGRLYARFRDPAGNMTWNSPQDLSDKVVAFPGELASGQPYVRAIVNDKAAYVPREKVQLELNHMTEALGPMTNMVPLKAASFPQRASMGSRMLTQALPLENPEAPFVQAGVPGTDTSFEELYGDKMGAVRSKVSGVVVSTEPGSIKIRDEQGKTQNVELYNNQPHNRKTFLHNDPVVQPGQRVNAGDLLARSSFTDNKGTTAVGRNLRVAFTSYHGKNFEDAIVVSEGASKKLASVHMYQNSVDLDENTKISKNAFVSTFPAKYDKDVLQKYDDDGVVKVGETVNMDDPLILAIKQRTSGPKLGRRSYSWSDASSAWEHHAPGIVTDVHKGPTGINVVVKSVQPLRVGDKLSGRHGNKGVVSEIVPDDQMPSSAEGSPYEVLLNPLGVISRGNASQVLETALGKIVEKTGQPYKVPDFDNIKDMRLYVEQELKKHGISDTESITDAINGRKIPDVLTGNIFMMKLHHTSESKAAGRSTEGYTAEEAPSKGGPTGAKRIGGLEVYALMSHGAFQNLYDTSNIRGQKNEDYWRQVMSGHTPPEPKIPFVYKKFLGMLQAAGINPIQKGTQLNVMSLTNKDVDKLAGERQIQNAKTVDWRVDRLTPIAGGLFDESLTGGHGSEGRWSFIKLHEPMLNPIMEEPVRRILGLTEKKFRDVVSGAEPLSNDPERAHETGPAAIKTALANINLDKEIARCRLDIASGKKTYRDNAVRRMHYLKNAKALGQHPQDWVWDKVPVLPPAFRPISIMSGSGTPLVADPNILYKELFEANDALKEMSGSVDDLKQERINVYDALRAVAGIGDPIRPQTQQQQVKGVLAHILGSGPKWGMVQRKLFGRSVDLVGRGTIIPDPNLDMDHIGLPIEKAWDIYKPYIIRRLVRAGMPKIRAAEEVMNQSKQAFKALQDETEVRPIIANRAPTLHRYGIMAYKPVLVSGSALRISPAVVGGHGADFDGDAMQFHVPAHAEAVQEAYDKMLPSKNLLSAASFNVHQTPTMEYQGGLHMATTRKSKNPPRIFRYAKDAIQAYESGEISASQPVTILER